MKLLSLGLLLLMTFSVTGCNQQVNDDITPVHLCPEYNWVRTLVDDIWLFDLSISFEDEVELSIWAESYYEGEFIEEKFRFRFTHLGTAFNGRLVLSATRLDDSTSKYNYLWKVSLIDERGSASASQATNFVEKGSMGIYGRRAIQNLVMEQPDVLIYEVRTDKRVLEALPQDPTLEELIGHSEIVYIVFIGVKPLVLHTGVD